MTHAGHSWTESGQEGETQDSVNGEGGNKVAGLQSHLPSFFHGAAAG